MKVLITGGAGFIGSHMTERLLGEGHSVRVLDNLSTGHRANLPSHPSVELRVGDIREAKTVGEAMDDVQAVIHLAAVASVQASIDDPIGTHETNLVGTLNLLEAARRKGARRFLYASSAAVYGDTDTLPVSEQAPSRPLSPYAADKLAGEHYLQFYHRKHGLACTAFRFFNIYGPRQDPSSPYSGVISIFVSRALEGRSVTVFGDGRQTRDFVYVADLIDILYAMLVRAKHVDQVMNVGRGIECSLLELIEALEAILGRSIERQLAPARVGDIVRSCADTQRLQALLGAVPTTDIKAGLAQLVAALR